MKNQILIDVLNALGINDAESVTQLELELELEKKYNIARIFAIKERNKENSNTPEVWGKYLEYSHEAERYGAAICAIAGLKIHPKNPFYGVLKMTDTQNVLGCQG